MTAVWGPRSAFGLVLALAVFVADRANKIWFLDGLALAQRGRVEVTPFFDLVMVWNRGISYGLFPQDSDLGRWGLVLFAVAASIGLAVWLARSVGTATPAALGLIIGGALGNALDRVLYGAVADFYSLHAFGFYWYVFNLADVAIVAGVALLLYLSLATSHKSAEKPR